MYTKEKVELIGEVYQRTLQVLNGGAHDPYNWTSDRYPMKCLVMIYPRAVVLGIPEKLNSKMMELMNLITVEEMNEMMKKQMPQEMILYLEIGKNKANATRE
ncbi:hypothetical protein DXD17_02760 [[Ruminococcus] lactaris]|uniref:Uncharacterized protein n=1 Tax=[Ruminococcus] lactaris TaxID=46228 RepID=A0A3E4LX10_9FIRM|nr:hypothetical protein [[Ruminococcus] lactaris]RGK41969.1 hypothetical protein DXD17_02760 [[Ruminococcus] lactaris]